MEKYTVCQLQKGMRFEGYLLVRSADRRKDSKGNDYLDLNLADRTGEINCKQWNLDPRSSVPVSGSVIHTEGLVQEFNGRLQLRVEKWHTAREEEAVEMERLVPSAPRKPQEMMAEIRETVAGFRSVPLRKITERMLDMAGPELTWFPAAQRVHHAERSGLLHHTTDMLRLARGVLQVYPWLNADLLLAGVILHDLGKLTELRSDTSGNVTDYTQDGQLLGHLIRGVTMLNRAADAAGVQGEPVVLLEHMLISHHGEAEYGSPKPPMFPEAEALHWIDMMDARLNTMKTAVDKTPPGAFSERIISLDRRVYHPRDPENAAMDSGENQKEEIE